MEIDSPHLRLDIMLLENLAQERNHERFSYSIDLSAWRQMRREALDTSFSRVSKRSSYTGSRVNLDSSREFKFNKSYRTEEEFDKHNVVLSPSVKNLASIYTYQLLKRVEKEISAPKLQENFFCLFDEVNYDEHLPVVKEFVNDLLISATKVINHFELY
jgi:hypothetical protein